MKDKDIKKIINASFKEPQLPFDEWAKIHDVELNNQQQQSVKISEPTSDSEVSVNSDGTLSRKNKGGFITSISSVVLLLTAAVIMLFIFFMAKGNGPSVPIFKEYGANDVSRISIKIDDYLLVQDIDKIDLLNAEEIESINKIVAKEDSNIILGYSLDKIIYGSFHEDTLYAYQFDSFTKIYKHYVFDKSVDFENLVQTYLYNEQIFKYKIVSKAENTTAYISYEKNGLSYYFTINAFEDLCIINENSIKVFIEKVIN